MYKKKNLLEDIMRRNRILKSGATYLCTGTVNRFKNELTNDIIKRIFLEVLELCKSLFEFELYDFSVQDNCVELIIKPLENASLSKIMQWLLSVFAIRYNKHLKIRGHVWYDRFKSKIINSPKEIWEIREKLKEFPVRNQIVEDAKNFIFGGFYYLSRGMDKIVSIFTEERFYFELST